MQYLQPTAKQLHRRNNEPHLTVIYFKPDFIIFINNGILKPFKTQGASILFSVFFKVQSPLCLLQFKYFILIKECLFNFIKKIFLNQ